MLLLVFLAEECQYSEFLQFLLERDIHKNRK